MKKIYLDGGHGGKDPGCVDNGLSEKNVVLKLQEYVIEYLKAHYSDFEIKTTRSTDTFVSLMERANKANAWGADVFLSLHINAMSETSNGYEDYIARVTGSKTENLQNILHDQVVPVLKKYDIKDRGKRKADYIVLKYSHMSAILTETLFITNPREASLLKQEVVLRDFAAAYAEGVAKFLSLPKKAAKPTPIPVTPAPEKKDLPKVTSLGDKYSFQVKALQETPVYQYADQSGRFKTLAKDTVFSVYGYTYASWAVGGGGFVMQKHVQPLPVTLLTGGLNPTMEADFRAFLKGEGIDSELDVHAVGNPSAEITVSGLQLVKVRQFLDLKGWYYK
ncbi:N-acetylmuramoyl-L-alanine amidase family protein [Priestia flexa]|uniref:N-acetylmuramoyl-L-alanine amidase n=1 Tax=Priestia flexa TaxID=86664 RepID=A0ABU4J485_9BACI|nr:N-acetylmuramoyl-L-alanine amidase [Priestia flexa]MDW8515810.1 N-acetylmuramoyl-L-alanine amidase [Priestia flexa]